MKKISDVIVTARIFSSVTWTLILAAGLASAQPAGTIRAWGDINNGATATVSVVATVNSSGANVVNTAFVTAAAPDPNLTNNSASVATPVFGPKH